MVNPWMRSAALSHIISELCAITLATSLGLNSIRQVLPITVLSGNPIFKLILKLTCCSSSSSRNTRHQPSKVQPCLQCHTARRRGGSHGNAQRGEAATNLPDYGCRGAHDIVSTVRIVR
jgi:hypothetical protein